MLMVMENKNNQEVLAFPMSGKIAIARKSQLYCGDLRLKASTGKQLRRAHKQGRDRARGKRAKYKMIKGSGTLRQSITQAVLRFKVDVLVVLHLKYGCQVVRVLACQKACSVSCDHVVQGYQQVLPILQGSDVAHNMGTFLQEVVIQSCIISVTII